MTAMTACNVYEESTFLRSTEDEPTAGSGRCKACGCKGYRPNNPKNDYCKDCGHSWYMHADAG